MKEYIARFSITPFAHGQRRLAGITIRYICISGLGSSSLSWDLADVSLEDLTSVRLDEIRVRSRADIARQIVTGNALYASDFLKYAFELLIDAGMAEISTTDGTTWTCKFSEDVPAITVAEYQTLVSRVKEILRHITTPDAQIAVHG